MPNRFQSELEKNRGVIGGRRWSWQAARGMRLPVELRPHRGRDERSGQNDQVSFARNDILASKAQRAFLVLDSAGAWRRLAAEYGASGDPERASACKRAAHEHLFRAVRARVEAEEACEP